MTQDQKYFLPSGGIFACWKPYCVATVLSSGVAVCLCDPVAGVGGVTHFTYPKKVDSKANTVSGKRKYMTHCGENSVPHLLKMMYNMGATPKNIDAHIVGGGFAPGLSSENIGKKNIEFAKKILKKNKIEIINEDTSGFWGRKVVFDTKSGEIIVYKLRNVRKADWETASVNAS